MIGQYLSNTNKNAAMSILQKNLELNKGRWENKENITG
jgi:hypothetical protein